jgi:photosystem II stability/assembly factor-like uncharacterized protein
MKTNHPHFFLVPSFRYWVSILALCMLGIQGASAQGFQDPLNFPAKMRSDVAHRPFITIVPAGPRLIAVGLRGMIAVSSDQGVTWKQSKVPVQSDLLAAYFPTSRTGWAVGHDGVVLRTDDAGDSWTKQLDGRSAGASFRKYYATRSAGGDAAAKAVMAQVEQNFKGDSLLPYLGVWFKDINTGYAVGSFGMIIATTDGGKTWLPWFDRIDNPDNLNLNSVHGIGESILIAGERGQVFRYERKADRFEAISTGYGGSFFGLVSNAGTVLAFGLRGVVYESHDLGKQWKGLTMPSASPISAGTVRAGDSGFILVNGAGQILTSDAEAREFTLHSPSRRMRLTGVVAAATGAVVLTGLSGIALEHLPAAQLAQKPLPPTVARN